MQGQGPISEEAARLAQRKKAAEKAREQAGTIKMGRPKNGSKESRAVGTTFGRGTNSQEHLLYRLAREHDAVISISEKSTKVDVSGQGTSPTLFRRQRYFDK